MRDLGNFDCWIGKSPMPHVLIHGIPPEYWGEAVCKFSATLTVRNLTFFQNLFRLSNLSDFHHFSIFSDHFLYFSIVYIPNSIQNRSELFAAKMWGRCGVERAVLVRRCRTSSFRWWMILWCRWLLLTASWWSALIPTEHLGFTQLFDLQVPNSRQISHESDPQFKYDIHRYALSSNFSMSMTFWWKTDRRSTGTQQKYWKFSKK